LKDKVFIFFPSHQRESKGNDKTLQ